MLGADLRAYGVNEMSREEPKDRLERLIRESGEKAIKITQLTGNIAQWGHEVSDLANASNKVIQYPPPPGFNRENAIGAWEQVVSQEDSVLSGLQRFSIPPVTTSGSAAAFSMAEFANPNAFVCNVPPGKHEAACNDAEQLGYVLDKLADKESVLTVMKQTDLNMAATGKKSPVELFEIAWAAFEKPVTTDSPANTSLIPMRESIKESVEHLLRLRSKQELTRNEYAKILSIANQLAYDGTSQADIQSWADRWSGKGGLLDQLSSSKGKNITREEWRGLLRKASLFLREILQGLDHKKFKKSS